MTVVPPAREAPTDGGRPGPASGRGVGRSAPPSDDSRALEAGGRLSADLLVNLLTGRALFVDIGARQGRDSLLAAAAHPALQVVAAVTSEQERQHLVTAVQQSSLGARVEVVLLPPDEAAVGLLLTGRPAAERAILKIDADGRELQVLEGAREILRTAEDVRLLVELDPEQQRLAGHSPAALVAELHRLGFAVFLVDDPGRCFHRLHPAHDGLEEACGASRRGRLYCVPRERALSLAMFSHSSYLHGAERSLLAAVRMLVQDQGAVCTVVLPGEGPLRAMLHAAGAATFCAAIPWWCDFTEVPATGVRARVESGVAALQQDVLPRLRQLDPDVIETRTLVVPWGAVAAGLLDRPHVWHVSELGESDHGLRFFHPFDEVRAAIDASSNLILTNSGLVRRELFPELGEERCRVVGVWVEPPSPEPSLRASPSRSSRCRLAILASLTEGKDQVTGVRALAELVRRGVDAELVLAGHAQPAYRRLLEELIARSRLEDRVQLRGFVDDPYALLADVDVLLLTSLHEAFGRTSFEAALAGRPVVMASTSGAGEILRDRRDALWFEPRNAVDLADRIEELLRDPALWARLTASARQTVASCLQRGRLSAVSYELLRGLRGASNPSRGGRLQELVTSALREPAGRPGEASGVSTG